MKLVVEFCARAPLCPMKTGSEILRADCSRTAMNSEEKVNLDNKLKLALRLYCQHRRWLNSIVVSIFNFLFKQSLLGFAHAPEIWPESLP